VAKIQKKSGGGSRPGSGRKPAPYGRRVKVGITLPPDLAERYRALPEKARHAALDTGFEIGVSAAAAPPASFECMLAYEAISLAIQGLERYRDINPSTGMEDDGVYWTPEQRELYIRLNSFWDLLRLHPLFSEA